MHKWKTILISSDTSMFIKPYHRTRNGLANLAIHINLWILPDIQINRIQLGILCPSLFDSVHYPGMKGNKVALKTGKTLWSSEDYSTFNDNRGAGTWAKVLKFFYYFYLFIYCCKL